MLAVDRLERIEPDSRQHLPRFPESLPFEECRSCTAQDFELAGVVQSVSLPPRTGGSRTGSL